MKQSKKKFVSINSFIADPIYVVCTNEAKTLDYFLQKIDSMSLPRLSIASYPCCWLF